MHWFWRAAIAVAPGGACLITIYLLNGPLVKFAYGSESRLICDAILGVELFALGFVVLGIFRCQARTAFRCLLLVSAVLFVRSGLLITVGHFSGSESASCLGCIQLDREGLWLYNKGEPYRGSIISVSSEGRPPAPPQPGDFVLSHALSWPVYFRYFDIVPGTSLRGPWWTLSIFWWDVCIASVVLPGCWVVFREVWTPQRDGL